MDEQIETKINVMTSTSKLKCIMAEHDYCIKEDILESDLPQDHFVGQMEVKSGLIDVNNRLTNNGDISNCNIEIKEEILKTNSLEDNFVGVGEIKSEFIEPSEPSNEYSNSHEFSEPIEHDKKQIQIEKPKMKIPQLITEALMNSPHGGLILSDIFKSISARHPYYTLENKSWQDSLRCTLITNNNFIKNGSAHRNNHWILAKNPSKNLNARLKSDIKAVDKNLYLSTKKLNEKNLKLDIMAVDKANGVEIYKYVNGKSDLTPTNQKTSKPKIYECNFCGVKSKELSDFRGHTCFHELKCFCCGRYFKIQSDLQRHQMFYHSKHKRDLGRLREKNNLNYAKIHNKQFEKEKSGQFDSETQVKREKFESNLSEDNFVGLCEIKKEFSSTNDDFIENQEVSEIDPLEVQTENSSVMITIHDENKSFVNCPSLNCNYKTTEKDEFANHIALIHQGNITLNKSKKILLEEGKKQIVFHKNHIVKNSLGLSCPSLNCDFKTLLNEDMDRHINSIHTCHCKSRCTCKSVKSHIWNKKRP